MRVKIVRRFCSQPACLSCQNSVSYNLSSKLSVSTDNTSLMAGLHSSQRGASSLILALFVVVILVTASVALILGHKLGYQRGSHSMQSKAKQALLSSQAVNQELEDLQVSNKIANNQTATAKQELAISLSNLDELRQSQQELEVENKQLQQLNALYADVISQKGGLPLTILGAKIKPLPENAFEYGFDVGMLSSDGQAKRLTPTLTLYNDDDFVEVPLDPATYLIEGITRIRGRFMMPSGFKPLQVKLHLKSGGQEVEQLYDWKLGERVDNMPLSLLDVPEVDQRPIEP